MFLIYAIWCGRTKSTHQPRLHRRYHVRVEFDGWMDFSLSIHTNMKASERVKPRRLHRRRHRRAGQRPDVRAAFNAKLWAHGLENVTASERQGLAGDSRAVLEKVRLQIDVVPSSATYALGLGYRGGYRPPRLSWNWFQLQQVGVLFARARCYCGKVAC